MHHSELVQALMMSLWSMTAFNALTFWQDQTLSLDLILFLPNITCRTSPSDQLRFGEESLDFLWGAVTLQRPNRDIQWHTDICFEMIRLLEFQACMPDDSWNIVRTGCLKCHLQQIKHVVVCCLRVRLVWNRNTFQHTQLPCHWYVIRRLHGVWKIFRRYTDHSALKTAGVQDVTVAGVLNITDFTPFLSCVQTCMCIVWLPPCCRDKSQEMCNFAEMQGWSEVDIISVKPLLVTHLAAEIEVSEKLFARYDTWWKAAESSFWFGSFCFDTELKAAA